MMDTFLVSATIYGVVHLDKADGKITDESIESFEKSVIEALESNTKLSGIKKCVVKSTKEF